MIPGLLLIAAGLTIGWWMRHVQRRLDALESELLDVQAGLGHVDDVALAGWTFFAYGVGFFFGWMTGRGR